MKSRRQKTLGVIVRAVSLSLSLVAPALAFAAEGDGAYGRYDGDLDLRIGAGVAINREGPALAAHASALLLSSAGLYVHYVDAFDDTRVTTRSIAAGFVIEPLFLARTAFNLQFGHSRGDLLLDSFAIGLGAYWAFPTAPTNPLKEPGLEFSLGFGIPLFASATGPVLGVRGALRASSAAMSGADKLDVMEQGAMVSITLTWRHLVTSHLADTHDRNVASRRADY